MLQERPIYLPGCPKDMPCPLNTMKAMYPDRDEECQFDAMCHITKRDNWCKKYFCSNIICVLLFVYMSLN